jgi:putative acetyltransferase
MYTLPSRRGERVGGRILDRIEAFARAHGLTRLVLETGHVHHAAYRVYERGGFTRCGPVLDYPDTGWSVSTRRISLTRHFKRNSGTR